MLMIYDVVHLPNSVALDKNKYSKKKRKEIIEDDLQNKETICIMWNLYYQWDNTRKEKNNQEDENYFPLLLPLKNPKVDLFFLIW